MKDHLIELIRYFSRFVPKQVLIDMFVQPDSSSLPGYSEIVAEVIALDSNAIIEDLDTFVISNNKNFVGEKVKNSKDFVLFIEYGQADYLSAPNKMTMKIAITVVKEYNSSNKDNLNELLLMNQCLSKLIFILDSLADFPYSDDSCLCSIVKSSAEIYPVDSNDFFGRAGWTAFLTNE